MDYAPKSRAGGAASNVDINVEMDEVLKRIQVRNNPIGTPQIKYHYP